MKKNGTGQDGQAQATTYADEMTGQDTAHAERIAERTATFTAKQKKAGKQDEKRTYNTLNNEVVFNVRLTETDTENGINYGINKAVMKAERVKEELKEVSLIDADAVTTQAEQEQNAFIKVKLLHATANALKKTAKAYIQKANI